MNPLTDWATGLKYHELIEYESARGARNSACRQRSGGYFLKAALGSDPIDKNPDPYLELASRDLSAVIEEGRGHCGDITTIYFGSEKVPWEWTKGAAWPLAAPNEAQSLRYWVHNNLDTTSAKQLDDIFVKLSESDIDLFTRMGQVGYVLSSTATDVVRLLAHARPHDARALVVSSIDTLQPFQTELANCMQDIRRLQGENSSLLILRA
jgi:hypothetical protein